jgi:SAM-dependent methyltransferase
VPDWGSYLTQFHDANAGITEAVLGDARDSSGRTGYDWLAEVVPVGASVLDLACGSAPMRSRLPGRSYVGMDLSLAELRRAQGAAVARADSGRLPVRDASVDAVVISMALMLVPLQETLAEVRRVLRPGGVLVATVPTGRPLPVVDWLRYARLCLALHLRRFSYPNDAALDTASCAFAAAGLHLESDERQAFACDLSSQVRAQQLLTSLYLPEVEPARLAAGQRVVDRWVGSHVALPLRRLVAGG